MSLLRNMDRWARRLGIIDTKLAQAAAICFALVFALRPLVVFHAGNPES